MCKALGLVAQPFVFQCNSILLFFAMEWVAHFQSETGRLTYSRELDSCTEPNMDTSLLANVSVIEIVQMPGSGKIWLKIPLEQCLQR